MPTDDNPFASPTVEQTLDPIDRAGLSEVERVRLDHLNHEARVKSVGVLYFLAAAVFAVALVGLVITGFHGARPHEPVVAGIEGLFAFALLSVGIGLRRLAPWVRIPVVLFSVLGLLAFRYAPLVALISLYILYLMLSAKGRMVLSAKYHEIILQTPHIRYRTSRIMIALVVLLLLVVVGPIVVLALSGYMLP